MASRTLQLRSCGITLGSEQDGRDGKAYARHIVIFSLKIPVILQGVIEKRSIGYIGSFPSIKFFYGGDLQYRPYRSTFDVNRRGKDAGDTQ